MPQGAVIADLKTDSIRDDRQQRGVLLVRFYVGPEFSTGWRLSLIGFVMLCKIKNWREFQHYRDRNPPWIKLHFSILSSSDWVMLDDASRVLAVACMLVGSRNDGHIDTSSKGAEYMQRIAYFKKKPDFKPLIECGFLEYASGCKQMLADARPETEGEGENTSVSREKIAFDGSSFQNLNGHIEAWRKAYPAIDIESEISKAAAWLVSNPKNTKSQYGRFLNGWLSRAQDKAPRVPQEKADWI